MCWCQSRGADSSVTLFRIGHHLSPPGNILTSQGLNLVYSTKARVTKAFKLVAGVDSQPSGWIRMGREPLPVVVNGYWEGPSLQPRRQTQEGAMSEVIVISVKPHH